MSSGVFRKDTHAAAIPPQDGRCKRYLRQGRANGFTLFELIITIIVVAFLATIFLKRFLIYQELAEKASMEQTASAVKSGLNIQLAGLIAHGKMEDINRLASINPVRVLTELPGTYIGEFFDPNFEDIPPGSWFYDLKNKQLVYVIKRDGHFIPAPNGKKWVRYRTKIIRNDVLLDANAEGEPAGLTLEVVQKFNWNIN